ncbi:MAG: hypothetical protein JWN99_2817 [Ilumatobacteraceae bacterium]|nr:hypothetical protein [Ilumatobacteraceae bacterium]
MARLCERPGCSNPADVSYGFDAEHLIVWLGSFQAAQGPSSGVLCRRHADAMVVPLGWMLDDRREPTPRLFRPPNEAPTGPMIRPRHKRIRHDPAAATLQLQLDQFQEPDDLAAAVEQVVNEAIAIGQQHQLDEAAGSTEPGSTAADSTVTDPSDDAPDVAPWQPVFDERDDLKGLLKARGRLLSRAFNGIGSDDH